MTIILKHLFIIVGSIFSLYSLQCCLVRYLKIKDLPKDVINRKDKEGYLKTLQKYSLTCLVFSFLSMITAFSPVIELRLIIPIISMIICGYVLQDLFDEIADFDISKKDADIIKDFLIKTKKEAKEKSKTNVIKKVDSVEDTSDNTEENIEE